MKIRYIATMYRCPECHDDFKLDMLRHSTVTEKEHCPHCFAVMELEECIIRKKMCEDIY